MNIRIVGVDPGAKGGAVTLCNGSIEASRRAEKEGSFTDWLAAQFDKSSDEYVFVERQHGGAGFAGNTQRLINYGRLLEQIHSVCYYRGIEVIEVSPQTWRKFSVKPHIGQHAKELTTKEQARYAAVLTFGDEVCDRFLCSKSGRGMLHDGVVDAALIAAYGNKIINERKVEE